MHRSVYWDKLLIIGARRSIERSVTFKVINNFKNAGSRESSYIAVTIEAAILVNVHVDTSIV